MKKIIIVLLFCWFAGSYAQGLVFHGKAKNSLYSYETEDTHNRAYQYFRFNVATADNKYQLNSSMRALTDFNQTLDSDQRFKAYTLNVEVRNLFNRVNLTVGRQFLHPGTVLGGLDGVYSEISINNMFSLDVYGGTESHFHRMFKIYEFDDSMVAGGLLNIKKLYASNVQLLYLQKSNSDDMFWQIAGINAANTLISNVRLQLQAHYDMQNERMHRLLVSARKPVMTNLSVNLKYKSQYPQVYSNSWFSIFSPKAYTQYQAGFNYEIMKNLYLQTQYQLVSFEDGEANKVFATIGCLDGSVGFLFESGYAGDQVSVMFDYGREIIKNLYASINLDYSKYRTEELYEYDNQLANALRLNYKLNRNWTFDLEYQWLDNKFKENDSRLLNHITFRW